MTAILIPSNVSTEMAKSALTPSIRMLPSVDRLLRTNQALILRQKFGVERVTAAARRVTNELRQEIQQGLSFPESANGYGADLLQRAADKLEVMCEHEALGRIRRVINATGVILHTNLGRAPLAEAAREAIANEAAGYCTLEYDVLAGARGRRGGNVEKLLIQLTGAEDALVVNNCAAAALLVLKVLAAGGETIVSRGELIEIGGDFRVPDIMANSGTLMIEVGTTNRTRLDDYRAAISDQTRLIMRVHPSNYRIVGFTASPSLKELAQCAHDSGILMYEDAGSGVLRDLSSYGLADEPLIKDCIDQGADVVSFSGDKLLGAAQAGLIVGRAHVIDRLRKDSLYRALRADKLCLAALEATLEIYVRGSDLSEIPTLKMLFPSQEEIGERARALLLTIETDLKGPLQAKLVQGTSAVGGGSGPNVQPATTLIALRHQQLSAAALEEQLRLFQPPVIARVAEEQVLLDLRTVSKDDEQKLVDCLKTLANRS
jgi:L-seryl-tRNA(Ser) seleniumtransferase